jgi:hypothetical protein
METTLFSFTKAPSNGKYVLICRAFGAEGNTIASKQHSNLTYAEAVTKEQEFYDANKTAE